MEDREAALLFSALCYEQGHARRTQHILKVYALAQMLARRAALPEEECRVLQAAAILHDIPIRLCKEKYDGDASQPRQQQEAPGLVERFLREAGYPDSFLPRVLELVIHHHAYESRSGRLMQLLMEADLIVNCYEAEPGGETLKQIKAVFETPEGKELFSLWRRGAGKERYEETEHYPDAH
ncbi:MAG: HD domain-containing protein [Candidatus Faecalibacterium intestinavium]|uniref:HD domain-containing protein n=1 Tax=Candidatus Faecalibacterium intestinavium TaxID=2838580 RepID=A0A9E2NQW1_9FIRM|nr:HD domain-containing protein [Candidatus Faecalibacterium intestinavium]